MKRPQLLCALVAAVSFGTVGLTAVPTQAAASSLVVDLSAGTGAIRYGATGFLYGLGNDGIPTDNVLAALKPQVAAQKAPDGLQHPDGDALQVAPEFKRDGGREIEIYMQDIYQKWPYENPGMTDYLAKVDTQVRKVMADPNRSSFVYVPFNEPNGIWYSSVTAFENDWKTVYQEIRSLDPTARIAGPNYSYYVAADIRDFMTFAKDNNVLPDVVTWHELQNSFFTDWYNHYNDYRQIERDLGISARPITINEYGRRSGDLGVPGNLVQFVARFENSKVDACLAYWTTAGALNDLVTQNNQATGAWWLYKWYGDLTGNTVAVTPPTQNGSLQGLAALDPAKKQARVIFGGATNVGDTYDTNVTVKGLTSAAYLGSTVHATVWGVDSSGLNASSGPYVVSEGDYTSSGGQVTMPLIGLHGASAYEVIVTPNTDLTTVSSTTRYEAEYAKVAGSARVTYGTNTGYSGTYFSEGYGASNNASTQFVVTAPSNGYYDVGLRYSAGPYTGAPVNRSIRLRLNGSDLTTVALPGTANWNTWNTVTTKVFLEAGINRIDVNAYTNDNVDAINVDYIDVTPTSGTINAYEAEAPGNTLAGAAVVASNTAASGGHYVGYIGAGAANTLTINNVNVPTAGTYRMVVTYANGELGSGASSNTNIVDRYGDISVNGGSSQRLYFRNTLGWSNFRTTETDVSLAAGNNSITFANSSSGYVADIDRIEVAAPTG